MNTSVTSRKPKPSKTLHPIARFFLHRLARPHAIPHFCRLIAITLSVVAWWNAGTARADVFTNVPEAAGYQLVYTLPVPAVQGAYNTNPIPYTVNNAASWPAGSFTRVAYYLELAGSTDSTRPNGYVFVSFDRTAAFANGSSLGVPGGLKKIVLPSPPIVA